MAAHVFGSSEPAPMTGASESADTSLFAGPPPINRDRAGMSSLDGTQAILEAAMRGAWQRQTLLTQNISNAETPGYRREDLNFEGALRTAVGNEEAPEQVSFQAQCAA